VSWRSPGWAGSSWPSATRRSVCWIPDADPKTLLLGWVVALWLAATALACWQARRRPRRLLRLPVPLVFRGDRGDVLDRIHLSPDRS
jgi:hypothetical protein